MNKLLLIAFISFFSCSASAINPMLGFQEDADLVRLQHLKYWTGLIEEYFKIKGHYPFQNELKDKKDITLVKIATKEQMKYLSPGSEEYNKKTDNNPTRFFKERKVKELVVELESVLKRQVVEKYDIQRVPTNSPVGYYYFTSNDGYLVWTTCITCGVTEISTLLLDGFTPTVNVGSDGLVPKVTKALTRDKMFTHPIYKKWIQRPFHKEGYAIMVVKEHLNDSKK